MIAFAEFAHRRIHTELMAMPSASFSPARHPAPILPRCRRENTSSSAPSLTMRNFSSPPKLKGAGREFTFFEERLGAHTSIHSRADTRPFASL